MFNDRITLKDREILDFLHDYEDNVEIYVLEESKQKKNELLEVAKAKGILVEGSFDLAVIKMVYVFPDKANGNCIRIPKDELLQKLPTLIGKPLNLDHIRRYTIGYFIDYRYIEKENKVIAYAIVFKEIFKDEWKQLLKLFKQKKLTNSYEIWSERKLTEKNPDGTKTLHNLQIGGGAIIWKEKPAFKDAFVLETAKKNIENPKEMELVYACLNKEGLCTINCNIDNRDKELIISAQVETKPVEQNIQKPAPMKIVCSNCGKNFEYSFVVGQTNAQIKCPNCFAILDSTGKMVYPPQLRNFNLSCPNCRNTNNWLILSKNEKEDKARIKCQSCSKEYNIKFKNEGIKSQIIKQLTFLRTGAVPCIQCGKRNEFAVPSNQKIIHIKCEKCGLPFTFDVEHKRVRTIESYEEIKIDNKQKSLKEDNKNMEKNYILEEAKLELSEQDVEKLDMDNEEDLVKCKRLSYEQKKELPDSAFAVVITVKDKRTGKPRKIKKYPIHDKAHARNALARLGQEASRAGLRKLGVNINSVIRKVLKRAKTLGVKARGLNKSSFRKLLRKAVSKIKVSRKEVKLAKANLELKNSKIKKYADGIKKFANKTRTLRGKVKDYELEVASLKDKVEKDKKFYLENAKKIVERRQQLKDSDKLTDEQILNDKDFELAIAKQKLVDKESKEKKDSKKLTTASLRVGDKNHDGDYYKNFRKGVDNFAFPKKDPEEQL